MGKFIRDFGFFVSALLLSMGIYCLWVAMESRDPHASLCLIAGAAFTSGGLIGMFCSIREHFILRDQVRYARGKRARGTADRAPRR